MGIGVVVNGFIEFIGWGHEPHCKRIFRHNRRVIERLPISDGEWPFMPRVMFSVLPLRASLEQRIPQYENGLIHFAGDYKNMYSLEADWIRKFEERLLSRMCWSSAVVNIEFSGLRYEWETNFQSVVEQYKRNPPEPPTQWRFRCVRVIKERLEPKDAIEGNWQSPFQVPWGESD
jgi:hypothetical protein